MKRLLPFILLAAAAVFFLFNSQILSELFDQDNDVSRIDVKSTIPEVIVSSDSLLYQYTSDHEKAKELYHQKVIAVRGSITDIQRSSFGNYELTLEEGIVAKFNQKSAREVENLAVGDSLFVKGLCSGLLSVGSEKVVLILCEKL